MYKDKEKQKQAHKEAMARYRAKNKGITENPIIEQINNAQDTPQSTISVIPDTVIPPEPVIPSDTLVAGNKNIYQRSDGSRYIVDACNNKAELPLLDIEEIPLPTLRVLSAQYTKVKIGNFSGYKAGAEQYLPKNATNYKQRVTS